MGKRNFVEFFQNEQGECVGGDKVVLDKVRSYGFDCVELSFSHDDYFKNIVLQRAIMQSSFFNTVNR